MTIVIFSLGQLVSSDVQKLNNAFEAALAEKNITISKGDVWEWMKRHLPQLRKAEMSLDELCDAFNESFSATMSVEQFTTCFNSMCEIDDGSLERVRRLNEFLEEHPGTLFVVVSHTNVSHLTYIMDQLEKVMQNCRAGIITSATTGGQGAQMLFATSIHSKCEQHPDTLRWVVDQLGIDLKAQPVISFLNTIQVLAEADEFTYVKADPILDADKVIAQICQHCEPVSRFSP